MSDDTLPSETPGDGTSDQFPVEVAYDGPSGVESDDEQTRLVLFGDLKRDPVAFSGQVRDPLPFREALSTVHRIVGSDYRYVPKDRSRYIAYQKMKRETSSLSAWRAQQAYFDWLLRNDPLAWCILDPVITVHPDAVLLEVFSRDEGSYACLSLSHDAFDPEGDPQFGTTNIDFSDALRAGIEELRSTRETRLRIGQKEVSLETSDAEGVLEKQVQVPESWVRGFLQVQSSATLPHEIVKLAPIDLYNILRHLRMHADQKGKRRGLKIELMPGQVPRFVLEPWEVVLTGHAEPYEGSSAKVVRLWGRRRLQMVQSLLPYVDDIELHILGSGLPSFWVLRMGAMTLTLGLTGFTASNWSQAVSFDLLLPRKTGQTEGLKKVVKHLSSTWAADLPTLRDATGLKGADLLETVQLGCQQGQLMYDVAADRYRLRPLTAQPLPLDRLEYRNEEERLAHDLINRPGAVTIVSENRIPGVGVEIVGLVKVKEDRREYRPAMLITEEGNVSRAECTCPMFRKHKLQHGPCAHLIALRLAYSRKLRDQNSGSSRETILTETRTYSRRDDAGEELYQVTLDRDRVVLRFGRDENEMRRQTFRFNSTEDARSDYLARLDDLGRRGFLDATLGT